MTTQDDPTFTNDNSIARRLDREIEALFAELNKHSAAQSQESGQMQASGRRGRAAR